MRNVFLAAISALALIQGCSLWQAPAASIQKVRGLTYDGSSVRVDGIARSSNQTGKIVANVLFVHGIGWTQRDRRDPWVLREADAIQRVLTGVSPEGAAKAQRRVTRLCQSSDPSGGRSSYSVGGLQIYAGERWFSTDDTGAPLHSTWVGCVDKIEIDLGERGVVNLYRLLWDDLIYDAFQYPHVGYDDGIRSGHEAGGADSSGKMVPGYEDTHGLRASHNAEMKAEMVSYGLAEASLYLGPVGRLMRQAVASAICAVVDEAAGATKVFEEIQQIHSRQRGDTPISMVKDHRELCGKRDGVARPSLTIVSESLGSKVVFDTLRGVGLEPGIHGALTAKLSTLSNDVLEVFLLSNQVPVLAAGTLTETPRLAVATAPRPLLRFVAVSEINDLLSYELVPYLEHQYVLRCRNWSVAEAERFDKTCSSDPHVLLDRLSAVRTPAVRSRFARELGFEVVDVRVRYAKPLLFIVPGFIDPLQAHTGYLADSDVQRLLVCGLPAPNERGAGVCGEGHRGALQ